MTLKATLWKREERGPKGPRKSAKSVRDTTRIHARISRPCGPQRAASSYSSIWSRSYKKQHAPFWGIQPAVLSPNLFLRSKQNPQSASLKQNTKFNFPLVPVALGGQPSQNHDEFGSSRSPTPDWATSMHHRALSSLFCNARHQQLLFPRSPPGPLQQSDQLACCLTRLP